MVEMPLVLPSSSGISSGYPGRHRASLLVAQLANQDPPRLVKHFREDGGYLPPKCHSRRKEFRHRQGKVPSSLSHAAAPHFGCGAMTCVCSSQTYGEGSLRGAQAVG